MLTRASLLLGLSVLAVFSSVRFGVPGSGGLCTLVAAFLAGLGWGDAKVMCLRLIFSVQMLNPSQVFDLKSYFLHIRRCSPAQAPIASSHQSGIEVSLTWWPGPQTVTLCK